MNHSPLKTLDLGFTILELFDDYVISRIREEVVFDRTEMEVLVSTLNEHYSHQEYVYFSERINPYNVNPVIYLDLNAVKNLRGISIITFDRLAFRTARYEKHFASIPFEIFHSLRDARDWASRILKEKKQTCKPDSVL